MIAPKKFGYLFLFTILFASFMPHNAMANQWSKERVSSKRSILLDEKETVASDLFKSQARGEFFSEGYVEIGNLQNGKLYIMIRTLAHRDVDRIYHVLLLERWSDDREDWIQAGYWEFEKTTDKNDGNMFMMTQELIVSDQPLNNHYRARGLHLVELNGASEGCTTATNGVKLTDHPT